MMGPPGDDGPLGLEGPQVGRDKINSTQFPMLLSV